MPTSTRGDSVWRANEQWRFRPERYGCASMPTSHVCRLRTVDNLVCVDIRAVPFFWATGCQALVCPVVSHRSVGTWIWTGREDSRFRDDRLAGHPSRWTCVVGGLLVEFDENPRLEIQFDSVQVNSAFSNSPGIPILEPKYVVGTRLGHHPLFIVSGIWFASRLTP